MNSLINRMARISVTRSRNALSNLAGVRNGALLPMSLPAMASRFQGQSPISATNRDSFFTGVRGFSTDSTPSETKTATVFTDEASGQQFGMVLDTRRMPRLKPSIVRRRLAKCKTYVGTEKTIRQSPWKLNRVCQLAAGLTLEEALTQLRFCDIKNSDLVAKVLRRTSNLADIRDGLQISQLEVAECFTTKAMMLKRIKPMGRGRAGIMHHKYSHIRAVLREIDFPLKIYQAKSLNQKKKWLSHQHRAEQDARAAKAKREETERLLRQQEQQLQERKAAANK